MALFVVQDILADPANVSFLRTERIMTVAESFTVLIEQFLGFPLGWDILRR
jgi:hypothetical protein